MGGWSAQRNRGAAVQNDSAVDGAALGHGLTYSVWRHGGAGDHGFLRPVLRSDRTRRGVYGRHKPLRVLVPPDRSSQVIVTGILNIARDGLRLGLPVERRQGLPKLYRRRDDDEITL
jgi:hypothetical protein